MSLPLIDNIDSGVPDSAWKVAVEGMAPWSLDVARHRRLVVASPHPDDETLGCGGLIAAAAEAGLPVLVVSVSNGESAYGPASATVRTRLAERRTAELERAMACLAAPGRIRTDRLELPDGELADRQQQIALALRERVRSGDLLLAPLDSDGHPDHEAVAHAALTIQLEVALDLWMYPVWAWHWHPPDSAITTGGRRFDVPPRHADRKRRAIACFTSQTTGPSPVLPDHFLRRFDSAREVFVQP